MGDLGWLAAIAPSADKRPSTPEAGPVSFGTVVAKARQHDGGCQLELVLPHKNNREPKGDQQ
jgi:hypothetical protein